MVSRILFEIFIYFSLCKVNYKVGFRLSDNSQLLYLIVNLVSYELSNTTSVHTDFLFMRIF